MRFTSIAIIGLLTFSLPGCKPPADPNAVAETEPTNQESERVKAEAGVGKRGQVIGDKEGVLRTPFKALFMTEQRVVFMNIERALNLYNAEHGFKPKTHEEFMEKIIKFNKIMLPELPEGQTYIWDAEAGELMVEKPGGSQG